MTKHKFTHTHQEKKNVAQRLPFSSFRLLIFLIVFAGAGYLIFKSFAAGSLGPTFATFESGNLSEFGDTSCHPEKVSILTGGSREGSKFARFIADQNTRCYNDPSNIRVHMIGFPSSTPFNINDGSTFWWAISERVPSSNQLNNMYAGASLHQDSSTIPYYCPGPAPFYVATVNNRWQLIVRGATADQCPKSQFTQHAFGAPAATGGLYYSQGFDNGVSDTVQRDQWYDFLFGFHMSSDNSGWFEAWMNGPTTGGQSKQIVNRINIPTSYVAKTNAPLLNIYYPNQAGNFVIDYDGGRFATDFNLLKDWQNAFTNSWGATSTPPPSTTPVYSGSSITAGQTLSGTVNWTVNVSGSVSSVDFWANGTKLATDTTSPYSYSLDTTQLPNGTNSLGLAIVGIDGSRQTPQIGDVTVNNQIVTPPVIVPPQFVSSSIVAGQKLSGTVTWSVATSGDVASVEFWANNAKISTDNVAPFSYDLDTTKLPDGINSLGLAIVGVDGTRLTPQIGQVTISNTTTKTSDLNGDNIVDIKDLSVLLSHYGTSGPGDLNSDGIVNIVDLSILMSNYGK